MTQIPLEPLQIWALLGIGGLAFVIIPLISMSSLSDQPLNLVSASWWRDHYVRILLWSVLTLAILALTFYLAEIATSVRALVNLLGEELALPRSRENPENLRNLAYSIGALIAVLAGSATIFFSSIRVWINERATITNEQGLITDRINKAVEGLGAERTVKQDQTEWTEPNIEVRIGAIFSLERISQDSARDHIQIMEVLCAYVRNGAFRKGTANREDIQTAITVIGRRSQARIRQERVWQLHRNRRGYQLDFRRSHLSEIDFSYGDFSFDLFDGVDLDKADFRNCQLQNSSFVAAKLKEAKFDRSKLSFSKFRKSDCQKATFRDADLNDATLSQGGFTEANFEFAKIQTDLFVGAIFDKSNLIDADFPPEELLYSQSMRGCAIRGADLSTLPINLQAIELYRQVFTDKSSTFPEWLDLSDSAFSHWVKWPLSLFKFRREWKKFKADVELYVPPAPPDS